MVQTIDISVVVPTRNERANIGPLIDRLSAALPAGRSELIFVDDSTDDTPEVAAAAGQGASLPVLVMHRGPGERVGGLGGAVVAGMRLAEGRIVVVMDGDLQHPPESIPELIRPIDLDQADLVVASRYRDNGAADGLANRSRAGVSQLATRVTKAAFPRRLREITDPMSGFFAVRASALDVDALRPLGFKILLEAVARCQLRVAEIGFSFAPRYSGESKASLREGFRFANHLTRLRVGTLASERQLRAAGFAAVGATGLVVNTIAFWLLVRFGHVPYLWAAVLSTQVSTTWNFAGMELFVFSDRKAGSLWARYWRFCVLNNTVMLARLPFLALLVSIVHVPQTLANVITLIAVFVVRFGISDRFIYEGGAKMAEATRSTSEAGPIRITVDDAAIRRSVPKAKARNPVPALLRPARDRVHRQRRDPARAGLLPGAAGGGRRPAARHRHPDRIGGPAEAAHPHAPLVGRHLDPVGGALRPALGQLRHRLRRAHRDHHEPGARPEPPCALHERGRSPAPIRLRRPGLHAAPRGLHGRRWAGGDAVGQDRHRQDRHGAQAPPDQPWAASCPTT